MFVDQRLLLIVFVLLFLAILIICLINFNNRIRHNKKIKALGKRMQCFVINLEKNAERLNHFLNSYFNSDLNVIKLERFNAIYGRKLDLKDYVTNKAYDQIISAEKNGYRVRHYELTRGAVGCFLSHASIFKKLLSDNKHEFYMIFEDDAFVPPKVIHRLEYFVTNAPNDWDILVFGVIREVLYDKGQLFDKVKTWWGLFGYIINKRGAEKFMREFQVNKIDKQIDSMMSMMIVENKLNVYSSRIHLISHNAEGTDIQLPIKVQRNIDPFKYGNVELFSQDIDQEQEQNTPIVELPYIV